MKWLLFLTILSSAHALALTPPALTLMLDGDEVTPPVDLSTLQVQDMQVYSQPIKTTEGYRGFTFMDLLKLAAPKDMAKVVEVELCTANDYKVYYPISMFQKVTSLMSFARTDGAPFVRFSGLRKELISLSPYYLVWDHRQMSTHEKALYNNIYQVRAVNFVTAPVILGVNPQEVDANIQLGQRTYKQFCLACHALQSEGGQVSMNFLERNTIALKGRDYFVKYALDPEKMNPRTVMPGLPNFQNRENMAQAVVDFLLFMEKPEAFYKDKKITPLQERYKKLTRLLEEARAKSNH
jgi:hypothetical protein